MPSDEILVAFLDGELDPDKRSQLEHLVETDEAVAERMSFLASSNLPFRDAFEPLLHKAPKAELETMLADVLPPLPVKEQARGWSRRSFLAACVGFIAVGIAADRTFLGVQASLRDEPDGSDWRSAVAQYMSLYTADTLGTGPVDVALQTSQLRTVGSKLGLTLTPDQVQLPGATLKRAWMLAYEGKALAQITYLDANQAPMALCIVQSPKGAKAPEIEQRHGMNVVYWSSPTHAFMLIGKEPLEDIKAMSEELRRSITV
ncbi:anti-sigma factor [Phyllobacterium sp. 628]|nr:anti-sigma factor [Phyllobacterium sp. 628]